MHPKMIKAKKHLKKLREIVSKNKSPLHGLTEEQIIAKLRKTREEIWEEKLAAHP